MNVLQNDMLISLTVMTRNWEREYPKTKSKIVRVHAMKAFVGNRGTARSFSDLAGGGGKRSASRPDRFTRGERLAGTHRIGD
jgi:hypothetical protein